MSVVKSEQGESRVQFLETGRNIYKAVMALVVKLPKRYTFYIGRSIYEAAREGYRHVKAANAIYPTNQHEAQMRRGCATSMPKGADARPAQAPHLPRLGQPWKDVVHGCSAFDGIMARVYPAQPGLPCHTACNRLFQITV